MDPFEKLPEEIHEDLLKYFDIKELFDVMSLVSKSWYKIIANSSDCMAKLRLNLKSKRKNDFSDRIETLEWMGREGGRRYQDIQINCLLDESITNAVWKFLPSVADSVETLNIRSMKLDTPLTAFSLPKLEDLKMMFIPREAMNFLLKSSSNFKVLILRNEFPLCYDGIDYNPSVETIASIKELVTRNDKLVELELQARPNFLSFFRVDLTKFVSFKLEKFIVKIEMGPDQVLPANEANLIKFLAHQSATLKHVYVDKCGPNVIQQVFNKMPELEFIRFEIEQREGSKVDLKELNLVPNEKIKQFELPYVANAEALKEFLELVPNVEELLIGHLVPRFLEHAARTLPKLKSVVYRYDDTFGGGEAFYKNLKEAEPEANQHIEFTLCNDFL